MLNLNVIVLSNMKRAKQQIKQLTSEFRRLSDKKPNDTVNLFKLQLVNAVLSTVNDNIVDNLPVPNFDLFDEDVMPSNSDVLLVLSLYETELNNYRYDND